jgi:glutathione S-transferase
VRENAVEQYSYVALVSLLAVLVYSWMATRVGRARLRSQVRAPAMTGDEGMERAIRAHLNTLEWLPTFLVSLWLFALYWRPDVAAAIGAVWILGRIAYAIGYTREPRLRAPGFMVQGAATAVLLFGAIGRIIWSLAT